MRSWTGHTQTDRQTDRWTAAVTTDDGRGERLSTTRRPSLQPVVHRSSSWQMRLSTVIHFKMYVSYISVSITGWICSSPVLTATHHSRQMIAKKHSLSHQLTAQWHIEITIFIVYCFRYVIAPLTGVINNVFCICICCFISAFRL